MKVEVNSENYNKQRAITDIIDAHLLKIENETGLFSNPNYMLRHDSFKELVAMGDKIVNYLFHIMFEHGSSWIILHILRQIVENKPNIPKEHMGKFKHITVDWMTWYLESDYYKNNDIYYNLV